MKASLLKVTAIGGLILFLTACSQSSNNEKIEGRWYTQNQVEQGSNVFKTNCLECHGKNAQGITKDWKATLPDGSYPPPPLNGSAHAWHHPKKLLLRTINKGGAPVGGKMPAFDNKLSKAEKEAVIAYFQNFWKDEIYQAWEKRGGLK